MKIRISDIPAEGLNINDTIALEPLNARLQAGEPCDIYFLQAPRVSLMVRRNPGGAQTSGTISSRYKQPCSLCLDEVERDIEISFDYILQHKSPATDDPTGGSLDDVGIIFFEGEHVDLEDSIQESLILSLSRFWHPPLKPDGSCSICHKNLRDQIKEEPENTFSLGELFKKSGISNN